MRRYPLLLALILGLAAAPTRSQEWCETPPDPLPPSEATGEALPQEDGLAALMAIGARTAAKKPAQLSPNEVPGVGEAVYADHACYSFYGADGIDTMVRQYITDQNGSAMVSGVRGYFVLGSVTSTKIAAADPLDYLRAAHKDKDFWAVATASGADLEYIWGWPPGHLAYAPTKMSGFARTSGLAYTSCGSDKGRVRHESWHRFGLHHNREASQPPPAPESTSWPDAVGKLYPDGTGDSLSYTEDPTPILSHDKDANNAAMANRSWGWIAAYNPKPPLSLDRECVTGDDSACLGNRFLVRVQWADVEKAKAKVEVEAKNPFTGFVKVRKDTLTAGSAAFIVNGATVRVNIKFRSVRRAGRIVAVPDLGIVAPARAVIYQITVTDTRTGLSRAWRQYGHTTGQPSFSQTVQEIFAP